MTSACSGRGIENAHPFDRVTLAVNQDTHLENLLRVTEPERIAIVDLADDLPVRKQRIFKILPRLGIRPSQRREASRGNQNVATVSQSEASAIRSEIEKASASVA